MPKPQVGTISWCDLSIADAPGIRDFYQAVAGWTFSPVSMGEYDDYVMLSPEDRGVAGMCHARGTNADLPPQWLIYITVDDLDESMARCRENGGRIIAGPKSMGQDRYCIIRDPAGAVAALYEKGA
ncbi:MAG: VOC family protein [Acidobacteria bacterium]|nr:VOC family protein [Acidobacteriota bacterium]